MRTDDLLRSRRTIHLFKPDPVPEAAVREALESARWAPNHRRTEPWKFILPGPETAAAVTERNAALVEAKRGPDAAAIKRERWSVIPGWLVVTCSQSADPVREREDYAACACAVQNFMLSLWSSAIGTKWGSGAVTRDEQCLRILGLDPETEFIVGIIWYGYPNEHPESGRRPLADVVERRP